MRALFFGTPDIAVPSLEALTRVASVVGVVCQPDRPAGRGLELRRPPVKVRAEELGLAVAQPLKIRTPDFAAWVRELGADVAVVIAYGRILPPAVLEAPRFGCLNLHASLLPLYRGAAPIAWAVVRGETQTGISLMQMDEGCDTGPVFSRHPLAIGPDETADELAGRLGALAARVVLADVPRAVAGELSAEPQDASGSGAATQAPLLAKESGRIDWSLPAPAVHAHVRGMTSWPGAFTLAAGKLLKVLETRPAGDAPASAPPGTVVRADRTGVEVACGTGALLVRRAQLEGRKPLGAGELVAGRALREGQLLG